MISNLKLCSLNEKLNLKKLMKNIIKIIINF